MTVTPASCPTHIGFPAGNCARCLAGPVMDVPIAGSLRRGLRASTSAESRVRRSEFDVAAQERARLARATGEERALAGIARNPSLRAVPSLRRVR